METIDRVMVRKKLYQIFERRFDIYPGLMDPGIFDMNLLGNVFKLKSRDLLYLYFDIENDFNFKIPQENIINGDFCTINRILDILYEKLMKTA